MREIILDTETTGLDPAHGHRLVEIACVELMHYVPTGRVFHTYLYPERDVPADAVRVHGLTNAFLKDKPLFKEVVEDFLTFIADSPLVIHNAAFDLKFLNHALGLLGRGILPPSRATDTVALAKKLYPGGRYSLDALCQKFDISLDKRDKHGALVDCELLAAVYLELKGGKQPGLVFDTQEKKTVTPQGVQANPKSDQTFTITRRIPSPDEQAAHEAYLKNLKDPLWHKLAG
jgi:DNA polymerase III subunit epsilon